MIYAKHPIVKFNPMEKLIRIVCLIMLYGLYGDINLDLLYISNAWDGLPKFTKYYPQDFFEEWFIQENRYSFYQRRNNGSTYKITYL